LHHCRPPRSPCHHRVLLGASAPLFPTMVKAPLCAAIFLDLSRWHHRPRRRRPQAHDAIDPHHPWAHSVFVLPEPAMPSSPWCPRAHDAVEPMPSLSSQHHRPPRAHNAILLLEPARLHCFFLSYFGPTNPNFDMLHCHIALICCIVFVLLHCFDVLHCHIALICYIATLLWYATLLLFCCIALIATLLWYATSPLTCRIALICYIATFLEVDDGSSESSGSGCF
jgi:hypothetical protein